MASNPHEYSLSNLQQIDDIAYASAVGGEMGQEAASIDFAMNDYNPTFVIVDAVGNAWEDAWAGSWTGNYQTTWDSLTDSGGGGDPEPPTPSLPELRSLVRDYTSLLSPELISNDMIDTLLEEVYYEVLDADAWPFLEQDRNITLDDSNPIQLPASAKVLSVAVKGVRPRLLKPATGELVADRPSVPLAGYPIEYVLTRDVTHQLLDVWPAPINPEQAVVRLRLVAQPLKAAAVTDAVGQQGVVVFDKRFWPMLAYGAAARLLQREADDTRRADAFMGEFMSLLNRMRSFYLASEDRSRLVLGGRRDGRRRPLRSGW